MTARGGTTYAPHESRERGLLTVALIVACVLHGAALLLPLPDRPRPSAVAPPDRIPPALIPAEFPPPRLPERPAATSDLPGREPLVPVRPVPVADPVVEPQWLPMVEHDTARLPQPAYDDPLSPPGAVVLEEGTPGLIPPRLVSGCGEPLYPEIARRAGAGGTVILSALIDEAGEVGSIEVLREPPLDLGLTAAAIAAVACRRYEPGMYGGRPTSVILTVVVEFEVR